MKNWFLIGSFCLIFCQTLAQIPRLDHTRNHNRAYKDSLKTVAKGLLSAISSKNTIDKASSDQKMKVLNLLSSLYLEGDYRDLDTSMTYNDQLYQLASQQNDKEMMISALLRREIKYRRNHDYGKSLEVTMEALKICQSIGSSCSKSWMIKQNLGLSFFHSSNYPKAETYFQLALEQLRNTPMDDEPLKKKYFLGLYSMLNSLYQQWGKDELVMDMFDKELEVARTLNNKHSLAGTYEEIGDYYNKKGHAGKALPYLSKAYALFSEIQHLRGVASVTNSLGEAFLILNDYGKARHYAQKALDLANQHNYASLKPYAYQTLGAAQEKLGNELEALRAYRLVSALRDSLGLTRRLVALADMQRVYEVDNARLEQQIALQNRTRNGLLAGLLLVSAFGIALIVYSRILTKKNRELARKKREIEEAFLKGQTTERKRVATELHDNLGGLLSAAKLSLQILDPSQLDRNEREIYDNVVEMMVDACRQVRTLSHNMLPEDLEKEGLWMALERLVYKLNRAGTTQFTLQIGKDIPKRLSPETEFNLYLISFELCNNVLKHAQATKAYINLQRSGTRFMLSVSDNGKGILKLQTTEGMGLQNIKQRASDIKGTFSFENQPQGGTIFIINIPADSTKQGQLAFQN